MATVSATKSTKLVTKSTATSCRIQVVAKTVNEVNCIGDSRFCCRFVAGFGNSPLCRHCVPGLRRSGGKCVECLLTAEIVCFDCCEWRQLDGLIARNFANQTSALGSFMDPLADKLLVSVLYVTLTYVHLLPCMSSRLFIFFLWHALGLTCLQH